MRNRTSIARSVPTFQSGPRHIVVGASPNASYPLRRSAMRPRRYIGVQVGEPDLPGIISGSVGSERNNLCAHEESLPAGRQGTSIIILCPHVESNHNLSLRRATLYPLSYGDICKAVLVSAPTFRHAGSIVRRRRIRLRRKRRGLHFILIYLAATASNDRHVS